MLNVHSHVVKVLERFEDSAINMYSMTVPQRLFLTHHDGQFCLRRATPTTKGGVFEKE